MDKYVVEEMLGIGGMGAVVSARRTWDGVRVALKVMLAEEAKHDDSTRRFFREARAAGVIDSPHVAKLLDFGRLDDGTPFMVLELLHGQGLDAIIRTRAPMAIPEAIDLILQAAEGIAEAHARGIVHRDIKPSNLYVTTATDGTALLKVLDFGISKATMKLEQGTEAPSLTETNATLGSPQYMSPEQLKSSKDVDPRTDIWSLGLILYKMLTGRPAFEAPNVGAHFAMILSDPPTRLTKHRPDAPEALAEVVWTCLAKDCDERWQDLGQLAKALVPFGTPGARIRAERIVAILDYAGVSSASRPIVSVSVRPDDPTLRDAPLSKRPSVATPFPPPPRLPRGLKGSSELGEVTKAAWSPVTGRSGLPARRARRVMIGVGVLALVGVAFGAGRLLQDDDETAPAPAARTAAPSAVAPKTDPDERKADWLTKARAGKATADELRKLEALCILESDDPCVRVAQAAAEGAEPDPPAPLPEPTPSMPGKIRRPPQTAAADPAPAPVPDPQPEPSSRITPKGPMVDTL